MRAAGLSSSLMERTRSTWTDERLDDLSRRVDGGFKRLDEDLRSLRSDMNARFDAHDARFDVLGYRIDALQRTMLQASGGIIATILVAVIGLIAAG